MGIFDELSGKVKKKAQEKALEAAKDRLIDGVKQRVADAKEALFGEDDDEATTRPSIPTKESEAEEAERLARKKARDEKRRAIEARRRELEEQERKEAEARAKKRAEEAERRRLEHEKVVRDFEQRKVREKAEVEDELAALKKRLGKK